MYRKNKVSKRHLLLILLFVVASLPAGQGPSPKTGPKFNSSPFAYAKDGNLFITRYRAGEAGKEKPYKPCPKAGWLYRYEKLGRKM